MHDHDIDPDLRDLMDRAIKQAPTPVQRRLLVEAEAGIQTMPMIRIIEPAGEVEPYPAHPGTTEVEVPDTTSPALSGDLNMTILEDEIIRVFGKWRAKGHQDEDTEPALARAVETFEAKLR